MLWSIPLQFFLNQNIQKGKQFMKELHTLQAA